MSEEGFSFFEIQTPLENLTLHKTKSPPESSKFLSTLFIFSDPKWSPPPPPCNLGGQSYGRLGLLFISATRKVRENTKKFIYIGEVLKIRISMKIKSQKVGKVKKAKSRT